MQSRAASSRDVEPLAMPAPLDRLPWDLAQDEFSTQGADFIALLGRLLVRHTQDVMRAQVTVKIEESNRHGAAGEKDQSGVEAQVRPP